MSGHSPSQDQDLLSAAKAMVRKLIVEFSFCDHQHEIRQLLDAITKAEAAPAQAPDKAGEREGLDEAIRLKLSEPHFRELSADLAGNLTQPGYILAFQVRPSCVRDLVVRLSSGREIRVDEDEWTPALALQPNGTEATPGVGAVPTGWKNEHDNGKPETGRSCTCHPDDNPPVPCAQQYALTECRAAAPTPPLSPDSTGPAGVDREEIIRIANGVRDFVRAAWSYIDGTEYGPDECQPNPEDWLELSHAAERLKDLIPSREHPAQIGHAVTMLIAALTPSAPIADPSRDDEISELAALEAGANGGDWTVRQEFANRWRLETQPNGPEYLPLSLGLICTTVLEVGVTREQTAENAKFIAAAVRYVRKHVLGAPASDVPGEAHRLPDSTGQGDAQTQEGGR